MDIQAHINEVWPKLHAMAEPAFKEVKTAAFLADFLRKLGYDVTENVGNTTALTAVLDSGKPGPTVAVRTDMDCLLFKNEDGSLEPIHACGPDAHMTIARRSQAFKRAGACLRPCENSLPACGGNRQRRAGDVRGRSAG